MYNEKRCVGGVHGTYGPSFICYIGTLLLMLAQYSRSHVRLFSTYVVGEGGGLHPLTPPIQCYAHLVPYSQELGYLKPSQA